MLVLLPPSEGKAVPADADPVDIGSLAFPPLSEPRTRLCEALSRLCSGDLQEARDALGLTAGQSSELDHNREVLKAPAIEAALLYRGVLYDALDLPGLRTADPKAYRSAQQSVLIFSGLWGVLRPQDRVPRYRCSAGVRLPDTGAVTAVWRRELAGPLAERAGTGLVVDMRSSAYAAMWKGTENTVSVRVLHGRMVGGLLKRTVVSHHNKATKGRVTRALLSSAQQPETGPELADLLRGLGYTVEHSAGARSLDVVVDEL
jgi:cytoplasmic iron level regulating protein YaaA (DUF328/UPF0246 family)